MVRKEYLNIGSKRAIFIAVMGFIALQAPFDAAAVNESNAAGTSYANNYGPILKRLEGQYVAVCDQPDERCVQVKMPKALGKVEHIYRGPLLKNVRASWIALSKYDSFVCGSLQRGGKVVCAKIPDAEFPQKYADLRVKVAPSGKVRLAVLPRNANVDPKNLEDFAKKFNAKFKRTVSVLQGEVSAATSPSYAFATTMSVCDTGNNPDPGDPPQEGCEWQDGGWACPGAKPHDDCVIAPGPVWSCPVKGQKPDPDPIPDPTPDPDPEPDPC